MTSEKRIIFAIIIASVVCADQLSKNLASNYFTVICNKGIAFGAGKGTLLLTVAALALAFWFFRREKNLVSSVGFLLIFSGGASNAIDRIIYGCVRDFISIFSFPSFNLADSVITLGAAIIFINKLFLKNET